MKKNRIDRIISESIRMIINEIDEPVQVNIEDVLNNIPEPEDRGGRAFTKADFSNFMMGLCERGSWDGMLYENPAGLDNYIMSHFTPKLQYKAFSAARDRYRNLHKLYPDGLPVITPEQKEENRLASKYKKNLEKGAYDDRLFWKGEKFIKYIENKFPNNPWLVNVAKKRLNWVNRVYNNQPIENYPKCQSMPEPWR